MKKFLLAAACAALVMSLMPGAAKAVFVTEEVTLQVRDPDGQPSDGFPAPTDPLLNIKLLYSSGGNVFTNQYSNSTPFGVGAEVRTITISRLDSAQDGSTFTPLVDNRPGFLGNTLVAITAVRGSITVGAPIAEASFTEGRTYIVSLPGSFDPRDPSSWNWATGTFVEFALATPEDVQPGSGDPLSFSAASINTSSANTTAASQADGRFLFVEDSTAAQNLDPKGGDNWITRPVNGGFPEGFLSQSTQTIQFADLTGSLTAGAKLSGPTLNGVDLAVMNAIFTDMLAKAGVVVPFTGFATGFGGPLVTDYNPQWPNGAPPGPTNPGPNGDFRGSFQSRNAFGLANVPEPSSLVIFGLGVGVVGLYNGVRRRRSKVA